MKKSSSASDKSDKKVQKRDSDVKKEPKSRLSDQLDSVQSSNSPKHSMSLTSGLSTSAVLNGDVADLGSVQVQVVRSSSSTARSVVDHVEMQSPSRQTVVMTTQGHHRTTSLGSSSSGGGGGSTTASGGSGPPRSLPIASNYNTAILQSNSSSSIHSKEAWSTMSNASNTVAYLEDEEEEKAEGEAGSFHDDHSQTSCKSTLDTPLWYINRHSVVTM